MLECGPPCCFPKENLYRMDTMNGFGLRGAHGRWLDRARQVAVRLIGGGALLAALQVYADSVPDPFTFEDHNAVPLSVTVRSNIITITGIDEPAQVSVSGGEFSIGCSGTFISGPANIGNNGRICVRHTSAASNCVSTNTVLTVGGVSDTFTSTTISTGIDYFDISGVTAGSENACPAWVGETNKDDCSYDQSDPTGTGTDQWIGPIFSAGYYAPGSAPSDFTNRVPPEPVTAPVAELPIGGKTGIPVERGFLSINDNCTAGDPTDDLIGGTLKFGPFERNVAIGPSKRVVESFDQIVHRLIGRQVSSAVANGQGGFDYIVGKSGGQAAFPAAITGSTTANGGYADSFPSQVGSQSSANAGDVPYWSAAGSVGIADIGEAAAIGSSTTATVWGYDCRRGSGTCPSSPVLWGWDQPAGFENVVLRFSTNGSGDITSLDAYLVQTTEESTSIAGKDSWQATTLTASGARDLRPDAFDDASTLVKGLDLSVIFQPLANDVPGTRPSTVEIASQPSHGKATLVTGADNFIDYEPNEGDTFLGVDTFTYRIRDADGRTSVGTIAVTITDPIFCAADEATSERNVSTVIPVLANDFGANLPPITVTVSQQPTSGTATVKDNNRIVFTPPADTGGIFRFNYEVSEATLEPPASCLVTVKVDAIPVAVDDVATAENGVKKIIAVAANDTELTDTPITITITQKPAHGTAVVVPGSATVLPYVEYTAAAAYDGPDSFRYRLSDADGDASNVATVSITVTDTVPVAVDDVSALEDSTPALIDVLANDTGLTDTPLRLVVVEPPTHSQVKVQTNPQNGLPIIGIVPDDGYTGPDSFRYRIVDSDGSRSNVAAVTIVIADTVPIAVADTFNGDAREPAAIRVLNNDRGLTDTPITIEITRAPEHGTATVEDDTSGFAPYINYSSDVGYAGTDTIRYRLRDGDGDVSAAATVTITVTNPTPGAIDDAVTIENQTSVTIGVLGNDTGISNRPITLSVVQQPGHGTVEIIPGSDTPTGLPALRYAPDDDFVGEDSFRYRATDADGDRSAPADVTITVRDTVPTANDDTANGDGRNKKTAEGGDGATAIDVMANDTGLVDGPFTMKIVKQPANGTATIVEIVVGGTQTRPGISYASNTGYAGTDTVRYRITDKDGDVSNTATLTLTVADQKPIAINDTTREQAEYGIPAGQAIERLETPIDILSNDTGRSNRPNDIVITQQPAHGTVSVDSAEVTGLGRPGVRYRSDNGYTGPDSFRYRVKDADGDRSNEATVAFEVVNVLTAVTDGSPFPLGTVRDKPLKVRVLDNDGGMADGPISIEIVTEANGAAVVNGDNTVTFTPAPGFTGRFPAPDCQPPCVARGGGGFRYKLTDAGGQISEAPVFIDVFPATVTDSGGSSAVDPAWLALLAAGAPLLRRRQRR